MNGFLRHIGVAALAFGLLIASCSKEEAEVIPRKQLAKIYAEMLMTDQWIMSTSGVRMIADTSLVYEPILEKYGYDVDDYLKTVDVYMDDPERFARIFRSSSEILDARLKDLRKQKEEEDKLRALEKERERLLKLYAVDINVSDYFPYVFDEPYVHYYDSLSFEPDSLLHIYRIRTYESPDTLSGGVVEPSVPDTTESVTGVKTLSDLVHGDVRIVDSSRFPRPVRVPEALHGTKVKIREMIVK